MRSGCVHSAAGGGAVGGRAVTRHEAIGNFESILDVNIRGGMTEVS